MELGNSLGNDDCWRTLTSGSTDGLVLGDRLGESDGALEFVGFILGDAVIVGEGVMVGEADWVGLCDGAAGDRAGTDAALISFTINMNASDTCRSTLHENRKNDRLCVPLRCGILINEDADSNAIVASLEGVAGQVGSQAES